MSKVKRVFGTASIKKTGKGFSTTEQVSQVFNILIQNEIDEIDTARGYGLGTTEELLGQTKEFERFIVSTKANPFNRKLTKEDTIAQCGESLKALKRSSVDIFYLHAPDRTVPFEETLSAVNDLYKRGSFKRLGLSNFAADEVEQIYNICKTNNYVLPSVYQGNYNSITRKNEKELFPLLRKLGMNFYAYSPLAGGFLIKTPEQIKHGGDTSRFDPSTPVGKLYTGLYCKDTFFAALETFQNHCKELNVKPAEICFSWLLNHSQLKEGDAIIIGASDLDQLRESLQDSQGIPLSADKLQMVEDLWKAVEAEGPKYHF